jgi:hypothetical protein
MFHSSASVDTSQALPQLQQQQLERLPRAEAKQLVTAFVGKCPEFTEAVKRRFPGMLGGNNSEPSKTHQQQACGSGGNKGQWEALDLSNLDRSTLALDAHALASRFTATATGSEQ